MTTNYHAEINVNVSAREAFEKINRVSDWWTAGLEGDTLKINDIFTVRFGDTFVTFKIIDFIPYNTVVWLVTDCNIQMVKDKKEWNGTKIVWEVSSKNGETKIDMTHVGLVPEVECYDMCNAGWNYFIKDSLFSLITEERGSPDRKKAA
jgi:hypothetical protein